MKNLIYILFALLIVSCTEETPKAKLLNKEIPVITDRLIDVTNEVIEKSDVLNMSDPALMGGGSGIIGMIRTCFNYSNRGYEITDFVALEESGMTKDEAEAYMNKHKVKFLNVKRISAANEKGDILACKTSMSITKNVFRVKTIVENDTCKIVLPILE